MFLCRLRLSNRKTSECVVLGGQVLRLLSPSFMFLLRASLLSTSSDIWLKHEIYQCKESFF